MMRSIPVLLTFLVPLTLYSQTDGSAFFISLMKIEFEAFQNKDPELWEKNVNENAIFSGENNTVKTKEQIMEEMKNAPGIFLTASENYDDVTVKTFGNTAILTCITTFSFTSSDGNVSRIKFKFTRVHVKEGDEWKLVYHSAIPI